LFFTFAQKEKVLLIVSLSVFEKGLSKLKIAIHQEKESIGLKSLNILSYPFTLFKYQTYLEIIISPPAYILTIFELLLLLLIFE
jgi:hypothetical protein